jgi:hypothetical protein
VAKYGLIDLQRIHEHNDIEGHDGLLAIAECRVREKRGGPCTRHHSQLGSRERGGRSAQKAPSVKVDFV